MDLHPPTDRPPGLATIRVPYLSFTASYASLDNHRAGPDPPHRPRDRAKRSLSISCSPRAPLRFHRSRGKRENPDTFVIGNAYIRRRRRKKYIFPSAWEGLISILSGQFGKEPRIIGPENVDHFVCRDDEFALDVSERVVTIAIRLFGRRMSIVAFCSCDGRIIASPSSVEMWNRNRRKRGKFSARRLDHRSVLGSLQIRPKPRKVVGRESPPIRR